MTTLPPPAVQEAPRRTVPTGRLFLVWSILLGGLVGFWLVRPWLSTADWNVGQLAVLYWTSKAATLLCLPAGDWRRLTWGRLIAYLCWPGMQPRYFLPGRAEAEDAVVPTAAGFLVNLLTGVLLLWVVPALLPERTPLFVRVWLGLLGFGFLLLFALLDGWALAYRALGFPVEKLWDCPIRSTSLMEFWGRRWNRIFSGMVREVLFLPLARRVGATAALLAVFLYSGVLHENVSVAARSGYGLPLLYFVIQAAGAWLESTRPMRRVLRGRPWLGWLWTGAVMAVPLPLLVHTAFVDRVFIPSLIDLGVPGLRGAAG